MATSTDTGRSLRVKARRHYNEGEHQDDEIEGKRTWNLEKKITDEKFTNKWVKIMNGQDFTIKFLQDGGFDTPMLFKSTEGLDMKIPGKEFTVNDVKLHVGSRRQVDVMDVNTQKGVEMSMAQFAKYYESKERDQLYNVISLEFSRTKLEEFVEAPRIVRQIDWVDIVWPQHLKRDQRDSTNTLAEMKYPKVQKYCLMSVAGCYTDFHIDFGGTSVWYHVLHGKKIFWLIPPSEDNLELYENWVLSGKQADIFLGDRVRECTKIVLEAGNTFMVPSGWIHAVYTPEDTLVFGGNILHSFHIHRQLRVAQIEDRTHVPFKFRYPFFWEMNWYALERYVNALTGKTYLAKPKAEDKMVLDNSDEGTNDSVDIGSIDKTEDAQDEMEIDQKIQIKKEQSDDDNELSSDTAAKDNETASLTGEAGVSENMDIKEEDFASPADTDKTEEMDLESVDRADTESIGQQECGNDSKCKESVDDPTGGGSGGILPNSCRDLMLSIGDYRSVSASRPLESPSMTNTNGLKIKSEPVDRDYPYGNQSDLEESENSINVKIEPEDTVKKELEDTKACVDPGDEEGESTETTGRLRINLCRHELIGLRVLHHQLENLPLNKRGVPDLITEPDGLLQSAKVMLADHLEDSQTLAVTGQPILRCPKSKTARVCKIPRHKSSFGIIRGVTKRLTNGIRRRRTRCRKCDNCRSNDCRSCHYCKDMKKYGGPGRMKQSCVRRQCLYPMLPHNAVCAICTKEDRPESPGAGSDSEVSSLMECHSCNEIVHPECQEEQLVTDFEGVINEDLANSWECPKCVAKKETEDVNSEEPVKRKKEESKADVHIQKRKRGRPRLQRPDTKPNSLLGKSRVVGGYSNTMGFYKGRVGTRQQLLAKQKVLQAKIQNMRGKNRQIREARETVYRTSSPEADDEQDVEQDVEQDEPKDTMEKLLMQKIEPAVFPSFVVRPLPSTHPPMLFTLNNGSYHQVPMNIWLNVFSLLGQSDLCRCLGVCKTWNRWCFDSSLWHTINVSKIPLTKYVLSGIVRRQPTCLDLSGSSVTKRQLAWLIARLPSLKQLHLARVALEAIAALCSADCPQLHLLNLQWVSLIDGHLTTLLSQIKDHRPGLLEDRTKLHRLRELRLVGSDITDLSMGLLVEQTPHLTKLDLSYCGNITSHGLGTLLSQDSPLIKSLTDLNVSGCHHLTDTSLVSLTRCIKLLKVTACSCPHLDRPQWREWGARNRVKVEL